MIVLNNGFDALNKSYFKNVLRKIKIYRLGVLI